MSRHCNGVGQVLLCGICVFVSLYPCLPKAVEVPFIPKNILIYGGNGFIGSSTSEKLIEAGHKLTLVNRGNWYWDTYFTIQPYVQHIKCDRMQEMEKCPGLQKYIEGLETIDAVVDFSAYHPHQVVDAQELVKGKAKLYIYISTDSVYEVCLKNHSEPSKESDAVRPYSQKEQEERAQQDNYGHRKLQCEEILAQYRHEKYGPPFVSLRLPDVFGPRDNTNRWWIYQMWIRLRHYLEKDVEVPTHLLAMPMSLVYVKDVAELILQLIQKPNSAAYDEAFNLAQTETFSLLEMLEDIQQELNVTDVQILTSTKPDTIRLFPSVRMGKVDISKAKQILHWNPTEWKTALKETVEFYEKAIKVPYFNWPRKEIIRTMQTYFTTKPYNVILGLKKIYGLTFPETRDEL